MCVRQHGVTTMNCVSVLIFRPDFSSFLCREKAFSWSNEVFLKNQMSLGIYCFTESCKGEVILFKSALSLPWYVEPWTSWIHDVTSSFTSPFIPLPPLADAWFMCEPSAAGGSGPFSGTSSWTPSPMSRVQLEPSPKCRAGPCLEPVLEEQTCV